jgi:hypothetical protein
MRPVHPVRYCREFRQAFGEAPNAGGGLFFSTDDIHASQLDRPA